jgi:GNAT superfamily N-acetyltransferase
MVASSTFQTIRRHLRTSDRFMVVLQELIDHTLRCGCPHDVALHRLEDQADSVRFPVTRSRDSTPIEISQVPLEAILGMRDLYRQEMNCQIVHDSLHARHFTDSYLICVSGLIAGYGSVMSGESEARDLIKEFYVLPAYRTTALPIFRRFAAISRAKVIEAQTNDVLLSLMLFDCAVDITSDVILFYDGFAPRLANPGVTFRRVNDSERDTIFPHKLEGVGDWALEAGGEIVATGGIYLHYNEPYGDISMEVNERFQRRGYGSYLVQELKRTCREMGKTPAARCNMANAASRATLQKAGFLPCGQIRRGVIAT